MGSQKALQDRPLRSLLPGHQNSLHSIIQLKIDKRFISRSIEKKQIDGEMIKMRDWQVFLQIPDPATLPCKLSGHCTPEVGPHSSWLFQSIANLIQWTRILTHFFFFCYFLSIAFFLFYKTIRFKRERVKIHFFFLYFPGSWVKSVALKWTNLSQLLTSYVILTNYLNSFHFSILGRSCVNKIV